ncbi:MAG TPA: hypothetical protein VMT46_09490 [Anaerolineaceae bacterium]|nr:hypothetical protein [Anaerolineaceae bacterium]
MSGNSSNQTPMAVDARGQLLAAQDFFTTRQRVMIVDLPTRGVRTLYGQLGDWLAWVSIALAAVLTVSAAVHRPAAVHEGLSRI